METSGRCQHCGQDSLKFGWLEVHIQSELDTQVLSEAHEQTRAHSEGDSPLPAGVPQKRDDLSSDGAPSCGKMSSLDEESHFRQLKSGDFNPVRCDRCDFHRPLETAPEMMSQCYFTAMDL